MVDVTGLVTFVEADEAATDSWQMSVSARHEAVLVNGDRVLLLADRGWAASGPADIWSLTSVEEIERTARMMVGPDEPYDGRSHGEMEADHWALIAVELRCHGVEADALTLAGLPHEVVLGQRLLARLGQSPSEGHES